MTVSILMCIGEDNYSLADIIDEAKEQGLSKRIPITNIPKGIERGISKLLVAHPKAILKVCDPKFTIEDLIVELFDNDYVSEYLIMAFSDASTYWEYDKFEASDYVPAGMLKLAYHFSMLPTKMQDELIKKYDIRFCMGVIGYAPITNIQYVLKPGETDLPNEIAHLDGYVQPVQVKRIGE